MYSVLPRAIVTEPEFKPQNTARTQTPKHHVISTHSLCVYYGEYQDSHTVSAAVSSQPGRGRGFISSHLTPQLAHRHLVTKPSFPQSFEMGLYHVLNFHMQLGLFQALYSGSWVCLCIHWQGPHCFNYTSFTLCFNIGKSQSLWTKIRWAGQGRYL